MSISYVDIGSAYVEQPGAMLTVDPWGMDQITRRYTGPQDDIATEVERYKRRRDKRDETYTWMFYTALTAIESAPLGEITITYKGTYDGKVPEPVVKSGFRKQAVTLNLAGATSDDTTTTTSNITYYAPYSTYRYVTKSRPVATKFRTKIHLTAEALDVVNMSNSHLGDLHVVNGASLSAGAENRPLIFRQIPNKFNAVMELSTAQFDVEPAGKWFEVIETNELLLLPAALARQPQRRVSIT